MNVIIRADASIHIGSGHIMRCLVLAQALKEKGHNVAFASRAQAGDLIDFVIEKGFVVHRLIQPSKWKIPAHSSDYSTWLQVSWQEDAKSLCKEVDSIDLVIVDHYALDIQWENEVKKNIYSKVVVIDDLNRGHCCDLVVDQNLWRNQNLRYINSNAKILLGPAYALLRPDFRKIKNYNLVKKDKVFVFFGGSDPTSECLKVINAVNGLETLPFRIQMITGALNPDFSEIIQNANKDKVDLHRVINNFEEALATSKYALGASGVSNWERFCFQIPTTIVSVADNQIELSEYLSEKGMVRYLGRGIKTTPEDYKVELTRLVNSWSALELMNTPEVDGLGSERVVAEIERLFT